MQALHFGMALFDKPLDLINEDDLISLMDNQVREGCQIEYKQAIVYKEKQDKLDFLAGVTSFANTIGGDLLIGLSAASGVPTAIPGWAGIDVDQEKQRIENLLRDQVEPRVAVRVKEIRLRSGNVVILIRVPWSWAQPHMVRMEQVNRFYYRHSAGKDIMNVTQLRAAFALTTGLKEQVVAFSRERVAGIKRGESGHLTPPPGPAAVMHLVPFESFRSGFTLDLEATMKLAQGNILPLGSGSNGFRYSLDGVYCFDDLPSCNVYTLIFRNAIMEAVSRKLFIAHEGRKLIPSGRLVQDVLHHVDSAIALYQRLNVPPPLVAMMAMVGVGEYEFATGAGGGGYYTQTFDREDLVLPEVLIDDFSTASVDICRPMFDALFNAAGLAKWPDYEQSKRRR